MDDTISDTKRPDAGAAHHAGGGTDATSTAPIGAAAVTGARVMFDADGASRAVGIELVSEGPGSATVRMTVREDMVNGHRIAHGGYIFLMADTAFACACNDAGSVTVAAGADITFLTPARVGDQLTAVAALRSARGRSGIYDVTVTRESVSGKVAEGSGEPADVAPEVIAEFRGRSKTLPAPSAEQGAGPSEKKQPETKQGEKKDL